MLVLQWPDVYLDRRQIYIRAIEIGGMKTGKPRWIDMSDPLYQVLVKLPRRDPAGRAFRRRAYVFGDAFGERIKSIEKAYLTALLRSHNIEPSWTDNGNFDPSSRAAVAEIDLHVHDIRHEAACRWLESGCFDLAKIQARLGHASLAQTATYLHSVVSSIRDAQKHYDQYRAALPPSAPAIVAAVNAPKNAHKPHTNAGAAGSTAPRPHLIKGSKSLK
jgi:integrase